MEIEFLKCRKEAKKVTIKDYTKDCVNFFKNRYSKETGQSYYPDMIVLHNTGGELLSSAHWWFLNPSSQTSAHYLVDFDGEVRQYVDLRDGSFCNGTSTSPTSNAYHKNSTSQKVQSRAFNANLYTVSIEFVGNVNTELTKEQLQAAVELIRHIQAEVMEIYGKEINLDREHIIGHYEVVPATRGYCGKKIQFDEILKKLNYKEPVSDPVPPAQETKPEENPKTSDLVKLLKPLKKNKRQLLIK